MQHLIDLILFCNQNSDVKKDYSLYVHTSILSCPSPFLFSFYKKKNILNMYTTYVTGRFRYITTCGCEDRYICAYVCVYLNVLCVICI